MKNPVRRVITIALLPLFAGAAHAASPSTEPKGLDALYPALDALYLDLHQNPELSMQEVKTAAKMAAQLRAAGFEVTEKVGGHGVVGVLRNGSGPTMMVRTDIDALPLPEKTNLPYASKVTAKDPNGNVVPVAHACGHDIHMTGWAGAATLLARAKDQWKGTLVFIAQPAEEIVNGANAMVSDGLMSRFPKPDMVLGLHDTNLLPAGQVGVVSGPASSASNSVDITIYGKGGHGAAPHTTVDPIVLGARIVTTLQTVVAREVNPLKSAVITVGTFHSGTKRNIISDEAKLELTVRSFDSAVQAQLLKAIERIAKAEALAAGAPREPSVHVIPNEASEVVINTPAMATSLMAALKKKMGDANVMSIDPSTGSEDFGVYGRVANVPSLQLRIGAIEPKQYAQSKAGGPALPSTHSPFWAPDREPTIRTAVSALTYSILELMARPVKPGT